MGQATDDLIRFSSFRRCQEKTKSPQKELQYNCGVPSGRLHWKGSEGVRDTSSLPHHAALTNLCNHTDSPGGCSLPSSLKFRSFIKHSLSLGPWVLEPSGHGEIRMRGRAWRRHLGGSGRASGIAGGREGLKGSRLTWLNCAAISEGSHILELVFTVPPFSFLGAMQRTGGALASKLGSGPA